jgi:hypothetical protein
MPDTVDILNVKVRKAVRVEDCGIIVTFTDGTCAQYPSEELASLRPYRAPAKDN